MTLTPKIKNSDPPALMPSTDPPDLTPAVIEEDPSRKLSYKEEAEEKGGHSYESIDSTMNFESLGASDIGSKQTKRNKGYITCGRDLSL